MLEKLIANAQANLPLLALLAVVGAGFFLFENRTRLIGLAGSLLPTGKKADPAPTEDEAVAAARLLFKYCTAKGCKEGALAARDALIHILEHPTNEV